MVNHNALITNPEAVQIKQTVDLLLNHLVSINYDVDTLVTGAEYDADGSEPHEQIYVLPTAGEAGMNIVGTHDELAVVFYFGLEKAHKHMGGEIEAHIVVRGLGRYFIDRGNEVENKEMNPGDHVIIPSGTPHFSVSSAEQPFVALVISSPSFNPDNIQDLDPADPADARVQALYETYPEAAA
jgi:uncharacterized RmlC-like cupin family protein